MNLYLVEIEEKTGEEVHTIYVTLLCPAQHYVEPMIEFYTQGKELSWKIKNIREEELSNKYYMMKGTPICL